jgi:hypothetical protein
MRVNNHRPICLNVAAAVAEHSAITVFIHYMKLSTTRGTTSCAATQEPPSIL